MPIAACPSSWQLTTDERHEMITGDGRRHLLASDEPYDIIVPDTMRPNSAGSGSLYSREFQELVSDRLSDDGLTAGWIPSPRVFNAVSTTYPHAVLLSVDEYNGSQFYVASKQPFSLDPDVLLERFDALRDDALPADQRARLRTVHRRTRPGVHHRWTDRRGPGVGSREPRPPPA